MFCLAVNDKDKEFDTWHEDQDVSFVAGQMDLDGLLHGRVDVVLNVGFGVLNTRNKAFLKTNAWGIPISVTTLLVKTRSRFAVISDAFF